MTRAERRLSKKLADLLNKNPLFQIGVTKNDWVCPYCATIGVEDCSAGNYLDLVFAHIRDCVQADNLRAAPLPEAQIQGVVNVLRLNQRMKSDEAFHVFDRAGHWVCPYCKAFVDLGKRYKPKDPGAAGWLINQVRRHLDGCAGFAQNNRKHFTVKALQNVLAEEEKKQAHFDQIVALAHKQSIFKHTTRDKRWVCPFCIRRFAMIDFSTPFLATCAPKLIAKHLLSGDCPPFAAGVRKTRTELEVLEAVVKLNATLGRDDGPISSAQGGEYVGQVRKELSSLQAEMSQDNELRKSLERAQKVQAQMLPKLPELPGYEFGIYFNASESVSGDFYDFIPLPHDKIGIVIADVSGHGLEAGLVMGMARKTFQIRAASGDMPLKVLSVVNADILPDLQKGMFVTAFYAVLDGRRHSLHFARAGHNFPLIYTPATGQVEALKTKGLMLGANDSKVFEKITEEQVYTMKPGQLLLQYTDGVTEAMNSEEEEFEFERLCQALHVQGNKSAQGIVDGIVEAVRRFEAGAKQEDDITVMCVKRL